jgi:hypothetical protein
MEILDHKDQEDLQITTEMAEAEARQIIRIEERKEEEVPDLVLREMTPPVMMMNR